MISEGWLYNRSHIIGFQISGLNDEKMNLMTGNAGEEPMHTYEDLTANHMRNNHEYHVLYRVTPEFGDDNLLAYGVLMESGCL
ncbi:MAG: DNA/RNA non-specific endonuclease [Candidatus Ornithospirochaeta sp.]